MRTMVRGKLTLLFMSFALVLALPAVALAAELVTTAELENNTVTSITVKQGQTVNFNIKATATGSAACGSTQTAKIAQNFTMNASGAISGSNLSGPLTFGTASGSGNCDITGGPHTVSASLAVDSSTPTGTYSSSNGIVLSEAKGTTQTTSSNTSGGKLADNTATNITVVVQQADAPPPSDSTAPVITPDIVGTLGNNGWYTSNVSLSWSVVDNESAISSKSGCDNVSIASDQAATTYTCSATSAGGTASESVSIKRDATAPVITDNGAKDPATGQNGWYIIEAFNKFSASDGPNGSGLADSAQANFSVGTGNREGSGLTVASGTVSDVAGNTAASKPSVLSYKVDLTDPTIRASLDKNPDAVSGWFNIGTDAPTVSFQCSDATPGSGLAQGACPASHTFGNGEDQSHSGTVTDQAGRSASDGVSNVDVDLIAPTSPNADFDRSAEDSAGGWFKNAVTVSYSGSTDQGSSGLKGYSASQTFNTSGSHSYSGKATDNAGNDSQATTGTVKVDATNPALNVSCPTAPVIKGSNASANWTASDQHSGLATAQNGSVALDTSSVGSQTATVPAGTARDKVGLGSAAASCTYSVVYDFKGFFQPIDNKDANGNLIFNKAKAGSTIPVKFSLGGDQGMDILLSTPSTVSVTAPTSATTDLIEETTTATSGLKYDPVANQYIYNWKTDAKWAGTSRQLIVKLADGTVQRANFTFTK